MNTLVTSSLSIKLCVSTQNTHSGLSFLYQSAFRCPLRHPVVMVWLSGTRITLPFSILLVQLYSVSLFQSSPAGPSWNNCGDWGRIVQAWWLSTTWSAQNPTIDGI